DLLCKNVSLVDAGTSVEEQTILFKGAHDLMKKRPLFKIGITQSYRLGPSVEEKSILIMEAQDRIKKSPAVKEQSILIMEAQDHMKKRP
ncbi:hypothetical protein Tco_1138407, partial [Tanacetum coccineum]